MLPDAEAPAGARDRHRRRLMPMSRLEAFSDGVLAIVITLLVLELEVPDASGDLLSTLAEQGASYLAYVVSFVFIGGTWLAHVDLTRFAKQSDAAFMRLNLVLLLLVSFLPYTTSLMAEHLNDAGERLAVVLFGLNLLLASLMMSALAAYVARRPDLVVDALDEDEARAFVRRRWSGVALVAAATILGFLAPNVAVLLYLVATLLFVLEPLARVRHASSAGGR